MGENRNSAKSAWEKPSICLPPYRGVEKNPQKPPKKRGPKERVQTGTPQPKKGGEKKGKEGTLLKEVRS